MTIEKKGLIYCPDGEKLYDKDTFMTPHALQIKEGVIRIYGGVRDSEGISRIKYIDVEEDNPKHILHCSNHISLDVGDRGCFDDNGIILGDIVKVNKQLWMYYVGFQHVQKVKFFAFSGLAISDDGGENFKRYSETPVMDRTSTGRFGRCIHTVIFDEGIFKCWYAIINDWKEINGIPYPVYDIWYTESKDGKTFDQRDCIRCITTKDDEYRIGRPKVYKTNNGYEMFYTRDLISKEYLAGWATSKDGICWERQDEELNLYKSSEGWDSEMACYPVKYKDKYIFYNGNGMGKTGVGYAVIK